MPTNQFDIIQLYRQAFGSVPYVVPPKGSLDIPDNSSLSLPAAPQRVAQGYLGSSFYATDAIGREYFCPVKITIPPPVDSGLATSEIFFLDYPVIRMEGIASIVSTPMVERKGAVHEIISTDDYQIIIRGVIINQTGNEIDDARIAKYFDLLEVGQNVRMDCVITDRALDPDRKVIIKKLSMPEFFGVQNVYRYEIEFVSDFIFELVIE